MSVDNSNIMNENLKVISITNQKGGVAKTTSAINIAYFLAKEGYKTLLIDLDPQSSASSGLGIRNPKLSVYDLFFQAKVEQVIMQLPFSNNLFFIPSHQNLAAFESEGFLLDKKENRLNEILKTVERFDFIIIDCPPSLGLLTINALVASDYMIIPVQTEFFALEGLAMLIETTSKVRKIWNMKLDILGILLSLFDSRNILHREISQEIYDHFQGKVFKTIMKRNVKLAESVSYGLPIFEYDKNSIGSSLYEILVKEILERI